MTNTLSLRLIIFSLDKHNSRLWRDGSLSPLIGLLPVRLQMNASHTHCTSCSAGLIRHTHSFFPPISCAIQFLINFLLMGSKHINFITMTCKSFYLLLLLIPPKYHHSVFSKWTLKMTLAERDQRCGILFMQRANSVTSRHMDMLKYWGLPFFFKGIYNVYMQYIYQYFRKSPFESHGHSILSSIGIYMQF